MNIEISDSSPHLETISGEDLERFYSVVYINGKKYISSKSTIKLQLTGTDNNYKSNSLTANNIIVKVAGEEVEPTQKILGVEQRLPNCVKYELTLSGIPTVTNGAKDVIYAMFFKIM